MQSPCLHQPRPNSQPHTCSQQKPWSFPCQNYTAVQLWFPSTSRLIFLQESYVSQRRTPKQDCEMCQLRGGTNVQHLSYCVQNIKGVSMVILLRTAFSCLIKVQAQAVEGHSASGVMSQLGSSATCVRDLNLFPSHVPCDHYGTFLPAVSSPAGANCRGCPSGKHAAQPWPATTGQLWELAQCGCPVSQNPLPHPPDGEILSLGALRS